MLINGAWYIKQLPNAIVIELTDGRLMTFNISPFRDIDTESLQDYKGYHPRKIKGEVVPEYIYRFYGLEKNQESLSEVIRIRLSPTEKNKLDVSAETSNLTVSEFIRDLIRKL